ncbi:hypothetical protein N7509_008936 [Penicillium cosmopolitanum]|uniref:Uncharacterized protein n=1 Tax=Penicillium cosmopolitanum TaxID=1131564 RepID=A0A9W9VNM5_9EURO|nr:uncharacterized protein N7509_008936 [Penicillium cosmopolitanum]KAJ5386395.1 hypothetical protein N7509_008936 [Penicillium cosmopolitanum]
MWPKGPFSRSRRPVGNNPTLDDMTNVSASADPSLVNKYSYAKDLPALPSASSSSLPQQSATTLPLPQGGLDDKRHSAVSPTDVIVKAASASRRSTRRINLFNITAITLGPLSMRRSPQLDASPLAPEPAQPMPKAVQFATHEDQIQPVRWDDYLGEPTDSNNGKTSQVNPRNTTFHKPSGSHASNFLHGVREQLQTKKKLAQARNRISSFSKNEPPTQKDARGRSSSRVLPLSEHSGNHSGTRDASPQLSNALGFMPTTVTTITGGGPPKTLPERPATEYAHSSKSRAYPEQSEQLEQRNRDESSFVDTIPENMMRPASRGARIQPTMNTYGPNDSPGDSPRESFQLDPKSTDDVPIMSRRRPVPINIPGMPVSKKPVRKPTPSEVTQEPTLTVQNPMKDEPKDAVGRIESLEAKRDELAKRRHNLETVIHELTRVIQPGSFVYDVAAKAEVKKSVQSIENEIAEIKREEHELGLKVARAWRRLDEKENNGDGSNLWIKRVTS